MNIVFLNVHLQRENNEKTMSKKENLNWVYLFSAAPHSFLFVNIVFLNAYSQREGNEKTLIGVGYLALTQSPSRIFFIVKRAGYMANIYSGYAKLQFGFPYGGSARKSVLRDSTR